MERDVNDTKALAAQTQKKKAIRNHIEVPEQSQKDKDDLEKELGKPKPDEYFKRMMKSSFKMDTG